MLSNFTQQDISCASHLTKLTWGDEMALTNDGLKDVLYEAMVRYYYRSKAFSLKMTDEDGMQGFLLAAPLSERDNSQSWLKQSLQHFECEEQDLVYDYLRYLSYNGQKVRALANPEDLLLCLFLSMKSGVGSRLLHNVEAIAQKKGVKSSICGRMLPVIMNITAGVAIAKQRILRIIFCRSWVRRRHGYTARS